MDRIIARYEKHKEAEEAVCKNLDLENQNRSTADELTRRIQQNLEEHKLKQSNATELSLLAEDIGSILQQVRTRKTQLLLGAVKELEGQQKQLNKEKQLMVREIMAAKVNK